MKDHQRSDRLYTVRIYLKSLEFGAFKRRTGCLNVALNTKKMKKWEHLLEKARTILFVYEKISTVHGHMDLN